MLRGELAQRLGGPSITSEGALLSGLARLAMGEVLMKPEKYMRKSCSL